MRQQKGEDEMAKIKSDEKKKAEENLMDLLVKIRGLEDRCKHLETVTAVPPEVYKTIGHLRDQIANWGIECVIRAGKGEVEMEPPY